mmetsp:Transcript_22717/g.49951  ORF Transcript_22717/g.49951 Transcript_22717/m.49951 type:complete len:223 (-) Transcript_22717:154-822(-)
MITKKRAGSTAIKLERAAVAKIPSTTAFSQWFSARSAARDGNTCCKESRLMMPAVKSTKGAHAANSPAMAAQPTSSVKNDRPTCKFWKTTSLGSGASRNLNSSLSSPNCSCSARRASIRVAKVTKPQSEQTSGSKLCPATMSLALSAETSSSSISTERKGTLTLEVSGCRGSLPEDDSSLCCSSRRLCSASCLASHALAISSRCRRRSSKDVFRTTYALTIA